MRLRVGGKLEIREITIIIGSINKLLGKDFKKRFKLRLRSLVSLLLGFCDPWLQKSSYCPSMCDIKTIHVSSSLMIVQCFACTEV